MSIECVTYVGYGVMLPFHQQLNGDLEAYVQGHNHKGLQVISDGMSGKYTFVGHIVGKTDEIGDMEHVEFGSSTIHVKATKEAGVTFITALLKLVAQIDPNIKPSDLNIIWHAWSHYQ